MGKSTFLQDFKAFAMKGNVIDMAVGVVIGGAFGKIVTSVVNDIIMPPIGLAVGGVNFKDLKWVMQEAVPEVVTPAGDVLTPGLHPCTPEAMERFRDISRSYIPTAMLRGESQI